MAEVPTSVSTISGNTIKLIVDHDASSHSMSCHVDEGSQSSKYHSAEEFQNHDESQFTKVSLNDVVQKTLADQHSDVGRQMRKWLSDGEAVPKSLIYTALKQALDHVDPTKPVLIVDRRLSIATRPLKPVGQEVLYENSHTGQTDLERKLSNGFAVTGAQNDHSPKRMPENEINGRQEQEPESCPKRIFKILKNALLPPDEPIPESEKQEESKSNFLIRYFKKMRGGQKRPPYERPLEALQSLIVSFTGMLTLTTIDFFLLPNTDYSLVIGSFGATAVLVFCAIKSPLAQPRNVIGGHLLAGIIGAAFQLLLGLKYPWLAAALAVSVSIAIMSLTNTVHPPAGATALIAVYSSEKIHKIGFMYVLIPVLAGAAILLLVAVIMNNLFPSRRYPLYWL